MHIIVGPLQDWIDYGDFNGGARDNLCFPISIHNRVETMLGNTIIITRYPCMTFLHENTGRGPWVSAPVIGPKRDKPIYFRCMNINFLLIFHYFYYFGS
jgi:hypothetical protein